MFSVNNKQISDKIDSSLAMPIAVDQSSSSSDANLPSQTLDTDIPLESYQQRLKLLAAPPYHEYCDAFLSTLCAAKEAANIVVSGKFQLAQPKRQKALSYGVSVLCDTGAAFGVPGGTIQKATDDLADHFFGKSRAKGYQRVVDMAANPMHFVFFAQALTDCLLFYFEPSWGEGLQPKNAATMGRQVATNLMSAIRHKELVFAEDATLAQRLERCLEHIADKGLIGAPLQDNGNWVTGKHEHILLLATVQTLGLPEELLLRLDEFVKRLEIMEEALSKMPEESEKKKVYQSFLDEDASIEGGSLTNVKMKAVRLIVSSNASEQQRNIDSRFVRDTQPNEIHQSFLRKGAKLKNVNLDGFDMTAHEVEFTGDKPELSKREGKKKENKSKQPKQAKSESTVEKTEPEQLSPSRYYASSFHHEQIHEPAPPKQKRLVNDEKSQGDKESQPECLEQFRGRRLKKDEMTILEERLQESKEDLDEPLQSSNERGNSVNP